MCIIVWNALIGTAIYQVSPEVQDPLLGLKRTPNSTLVMGTEGYTRLVTDELGYNNDHISTIKTNKFRILTIGDSVTESIQVGREKNYSSLLQQGLNSGGAKFEVFNLGQPGRGIPDYITYGPAFYQTFSPDLVIIKIDFNDFLVDAVSRYNENYIVQQEDKFVIKKGDYFSKSRSQQILAQLKKQSKWFQPIVSYSAVRLKTLFKLNSSEKKNSSVSGTTLTTDKLKIVQWQMQCLSETYGKNLVLLYIPSVPTIDQGKICDQEDSAHLEVKRLVSEMAEKQGIGIIDMTDDFRQLFKNTGHFPNGFDNTRPGLGHLNNYGHQVVAKVLENYLEKNYLNGVADL